MLSEGEKRDVRYLLELSTDLEAGRAFTTAVDLGLFERLDGEGRTPREIARPGERWEAIARLLRFLAATDLLEGESGTYRRTRMAEDYLARGGVLDVRPMLRLHHRIYEVWGAFGRAVRGGDGRGRIGETFFDAPFAEAMEVRAALTAEPVTRELASLLEDARFLDLGAGSGGFGRAFVEIGGARGGVCTELPEAAEVTRRYVRRDGLSSRIEVREADLRTAQNFGSGFDLVFASALLRLFGPEAARRVVERSFRALRPGGRLVIFDYFPPEDDPWPVGAALFHLTMWLVTEEGGIYPETRYRAWLREAGFGAIEREDFAEEGTLLLARRPE